MSLPNGNEIKRHTYRFPIDDPTRIGEVRRFISEMSNSLGFSDVTKGKASIIVNEMGTNLCRHAKGGEILLQALPSESAMQILAIDRGPGISDLENSLRDGVSSGSTPGTGLGAIRRQANEFDIYSQIGKGTCVLAKVCQASTEATLPNFQFGAISIPLDGEPVCGDAWTVKSDDGVTAVLVTDGLGHGLFANEAALAAIETFEENYLKPQDQLIQTLHGKLRSTRGAAVFTVNFEVKSDVLNFAGVGNVRAFVYHDGASKGMMSQNGTAGLQIRRTQSLSVKYPVGAVLVMASDGLLTKAEIGTYPGLAYRHPALIAGVLYRDFTRGTDDVTILVGKRRS